jgi:hypothetical protein
MLFRKIARQVKRLLARVAGKPKLQTLDIFQIAVMARTCNGDCAMAVWAGKLERVRVLHELPDPCRNHSLLKRALQVSISNDIRPAPRFSFSPSNQYKGCVNASDSTASYKSLAPE